MTLAKLVELQAIEAEILEMLREGVADQTMILEESIIDRLAESGRLGKQIANVLHESYQPSERGVQARQGVSVLLIGLGPAQTEPHVCLFPPVVLRDIRQQAQRTTDTHHQAQE